MREKKDASDKAKKLELTIAETWIESEVAISTIIENPYQPRIAMDEDKLSELMNSIREVGLIQPVPVARYNKGTNNEQLILIAGHRRMQAHKNLSKTSIRAFITDEVSKKSLAAMALIENQQRDDLSLLEVSLQYNTLLENKVFETAKELAISISKDESTVGKMIKLVHLPKKVIDDIRLNKSTSDLKSLDAIRRLGNDEIAETLYFWFIKDGVTREQLLERIKEFKDNKEEKMERAPFSIKNSSKSCLIKFPSLNDKQLARLKTFAKELINEKSEE